jgi:hypothetical protein
MLWVVCGIDRSRLVVDGSCTSAAPQAIKQGGRFVDQLIRALPFWHAAHANGGQGAFESLIKDAQRGTKLLQVPGGAGGLPRSCAHRSRSAGGALSSARLPLVADLASTSGVGSRVAAAARVCDTVEPLGSTP